MATDEIRKEARLEQSPYFRESVYPTATDTRAQKIERFRIETGNEHFRPSFMTWVSLVLLLALYPGVSLLALDEDPSALLKSLDSFMLIIVLVTTIIFQWVIFSVNLVSVQTEQTGLRGLGITPFRSVYFAWAAAFLLAANAFLAGLAWFLGQIGLPMPGEIGLLVPQDAAGRIIWVLVSLTAGFCEEIAFRGYLMTRLRLLGKFGTWVVPTVISALAFGACHAYQGIPGLIVISTYGALFSILYIRTGSLWPCVIAHSLQDLGALVWPH